MDFIKREYSNLMELQHCENVVRLHTGQERLVDKHNLQIDLLFEYCPYDLKKLILNRRINFQLNEIKSFMRQILLGLREIHSKLVSSNNNQNFLQSLCSAVHHNGLTHISLSIFILFFFLVLVYRLCIVISKRKIFC